MYLNAAILGVQYTAGANPMNLCMTVGLGHNTVQRPLHIDSQRTGQTAPKGTTVYAQADFHAVLKKYNNDTLKANTDFNFWATYWFAKFNAPDGLKWPLHEAYYDYSFFPGMNEYTIHQTFGPISYAYGYLASRK